MAFREEINGKPLLQFLLIVGLCAFSATVFSIIGIAIALIFYDFDASSLINSSINTETIAGFKIMQLISAIGLFIIPPIVYAFITSRNGAQKLSLTTFSKPVNYAFILLLMVVSTPFLSWTVEMNSQLVLPDFLSEIEQWMKQSEEQAMALTKAFLTFDGVGSLLFILLIVAIIPAIGEELLFRGVLQKICIRWTNNVHWGIWITAILFSALHLQFYGFLPRMLLGALFGYLFYWSKSLWLPILGHFINNGSVVIFSYFYPETVDETEITFFSETSYKTMLTIVSLLLTLGILFYFRKINTNTKIKSEQITSPLSDHPKDDLILPGS